MERFARTSSPLKRAASEPTVRRSGDLLERAAREIDQPVESNEDGHVLIPPVGSAPKTTIDNGVSVPLSDSDYQAIRNQYLKSKSTKYPAFTSRELEEELNAYEEYVKNQEDQASRDGVSPDVRPYSACGRRYPSNHMNPLLKVYNPDFVSEDSSSNSSFASSDIHIPLATGIEVDGVIHYDDPSAVTRTTSLPQPTPKPQDRVPVERIPPVISTSIGVQCEVGQSSNLSSAVVPVEVSSQDKGKGQVVAKKSSADEITSTSQIVADAIREARENCTELMKARGLLPHSFPRVSDKTLNEISAVQSASTATVSIRITIPEIILTPGAEILRSLDVVGSLMLILISRPKSSNGGWLVPIQQDFHDVLNAVDCTIFEENIDARGLISSASVWEGVGKFGLRAADPGKIDKWRRCLARLDHGEFEWNSFPVDALVIKKSQVSILMKSELRNFKLKWLTHGLLLGNRLLRGRIEAKYTRSFSDSAVTRFGVSKFGWRLVFADVDTAFTDTFVKFPPGYAFRLGSSTVQIRLLNDKPALPDGVAAATSSSLGHRSLSSASQVGLQEICAISCPVPPSSLPKSGRGSRGGRVASTSRRGKGKSTVPTSSRSASGRKRVTKKAADVIEPVPME